MTENEVLYMRSSKKGSSKPETAGDSSANEDDVWDDTLLVEAYDRAVQNAQQNLLKKKQGTAVKPSKSKTNGIDSEAWKVGDKCRCQYSEDLNYYEADIIDIKDATTCIVKYVGYENEETVSLKSLKPSEGDFIRFRQIQQAASENKDPDNLKLGGEPLGSEGRKLQKKLSAKKRDNFLRKSGLAEGINFPFPEGLSSLIPPPPPPHVFNNISDDEHENEAMSAMLISWYMSGYHTGYYQGLKMAKRNDQ